MRGEQAQREATEREPDEAEAFEHARVVRARESRLARLAEKDHPEELDHHIGGKRGGERDERGAEWQQHVDE